MAKKKKKISAEESLNQIIRNMSKQNNGGVGVQKTTQNNIMPQMSQSIRVGLTKNSLPSIPPVQQGITPAQFIKQRLGLATNEVGNKLSQNINTIGNKIDYIKSKVGTNDTNAYLKNNEILKKDVTNTIKAIPGLVKKPQGYTDITDVIKKGSYTPKDYIGNVKAGFETTKDITVNALQAGGKQVQGARDYLYLAKKKIEDNRENGVTREYLEKELKNIDKAKVLDKETYRKYLIKQLKQYEDVEKLAKGEGLDNKIDKWLNQELKENPKSALTESGQQIAQGLGQIGANVVANTLGGPVMAYGLMGLSAAGSGTKEALREGATLDQAMLYGAGAGGAEALSEKAFAGIGGVVGKGAFDDMLIGKVTKDIKNRVAKTTLQAIAKASGEGIEEVASGIAQATLKNGIYKQDEKWGKLVADQNLLEQFVMGSLTSLIAGGAGAVNSVQTNTDLVTGFNQKQEQAVKTLEQKGIKYEDAVKSVENDIKGFQTYGVGQNDFNTPEDIDHRRIPLQFVKTGNKYSDGVNESLAKMFNNSTEARTTALNLSKMAQKAQVEVEVVNTQELVKRGIAKENSDTIIDGYNDKGKLVLNVDSPKAQTFIMKHELVHDLEGTEEYNQLLETVVNEYKANGKYDSEIEGLKSLYQEQIKDMSEQKATEYLQGEIVSNEIGKIFSDEEFINRISVEQPNIFKKAYDLVKNTVKSLVKGSQEATYMEQVKAKFDKAYESKGKAIKSDTDIKYSIQKDDIGDYVNIDTGQNIFKRVSEHGYRKIARKYILEHFRGEHTANDGTKLYVGKKGAGKYAYGTPVNSMHETKMRLTPEVANVIRIAKLSNTMPPIKKDAKFSHYKYYKADIKLDGNWFEGLVILGKNAQDEYEFYDIVVGDNKKRTQALTSVSTLKKGLKSPTSNIPPVKPDVKYSKTDIKNPRPAVTDRVNINKEKIDKLALAKDEAIQEINRKIAMTKVMANGYKNKDTKVYAKTQQSLINLEARKKSLEAGYDQKIVRVENQVERSQEDVERTERFKRRKAVLQKYYTEQADIIDSVEFKKDKSMGIMYAMETPKRNFRDIMKTPEMAQKMIDEYITPTKDSNAAINKQAEELNNKVRALNLNKQESVYTMMLREQRFNSETTLTKEDVRQYLFKHKKKIDVDKVEKAIPVFTEIYDDLFKQVNQTLKEFGYKEVPYRQGYTPHFEDFGNDPIGKVAKALGFTFEDNTLPISISGLTENFAPGRTFNVNELQRKGDKTDYDILKGFDLYLKSALDVIHHTKNIHKLRALESAVRTIGSEENFTDALNAELKRVEDLKQQGEYVDISETINDLLAKTNNVGQMKGFVSFIHEQANIIANKQSDLDRLAEKYVNRKVLTLFKTLSTRTGINMIVGNVSSAISNSVVFQQTASYTSTKSFTQALFEARNTALKVSNEIKSFTEDSTFLTNRLFENKGVSRTPIQKGMEIAGALFEMTDRLTAYVTVRARYLDNTKAGMNHTEAMKEADAFADNLMQARDKGSMPTAFKSGTLKGFTQFQAEVNNQIRVFLKDARITVPEKFKEKLIMGILLSYFKYVIFAFLGNQVTEKTMGRKVFFSPADIGLDSFNISQNDDLKAGEKAQKIGRRVAEELPFIGSFLDGGRMPMSAALPDLDKIFKSENPLGVGVLELLKSTVAYYLMPFGGGQIKKTVEGLWQYKQDIPGSYTDKGQLRFEADTSLLGVLQSAIFGQWASKNARDYFDNNRRPLTEKQLEDVKSGKKTVDGIQKQREIDKLNKQTEEMDKKNAEKMTGNSNVKTNETKVTTGTKPNLKAKSYEQVLAELKRIDNTKEQYSSEIEDSRKNVLVKEKKLDYLTLLKTLTDEQKNELGEKVLGREIDIKEYDKYASLEEYDFAQKKPDEYKLITSQTTYTQYMGLKKEVEKVREEYSGYSGYSTDERKQAVWKYLNKSNSPTLARAMIMRGHYSSFNHYDKQILGAINNMDIPNKQKIKLAGALKYETKDWRDYLWG